jgi:MFS family permease
MQTKGMEGGASDGSPMAADCASAHVVGASVPQKSVAHSDLPTLPEVVDNIGFGLAQLKAGCIGGGVYFADGAELLLISAVTDAVGKQWEMSAGERGMVVTIVFLGIMAGNFASGPIGDNYGRRQLIIAGFAGIFVFSILSSLTFNVATLAITRFFVGMSFGIGQPAWNTLG